MADGPDQTHAAPEFCSRARPRRRHLFRNGPDAPTIGLLLCETNNSALAEYALRDVAKPIGVSTYRVTRELPGAIRDELPTVEDLQEVVTKLRSEMEQLRQERAE